MRLNLKQLVILTCTALAGIVSLQVFWLIKTYNEKKEQLIASANNVMMETHMLSGVSPDLSNITSGLIKNISEIEEINPKDSFLVAVQEAYQSETDTTVSDSVNEENKVKKILSALLQKKTYTLESYKDELKEAFSSKKIHIPIELAITDEKDNIIACTVDTVRYKNIEIRSNAGKEFQFNLPVQLNPELSGYLQLAFPKGGFYLLKNMSLLLLLSLVFISVCCFSFAYMVAYFFKEKRLAEFRNNFMNNMAHELKTPISSASLALELLQDEATLKATQSKTEYVHTAQSELQRLNLLVDKVLKMAAYEDGKTILQTAEFKARPWIEQIIDSIAPLRNELTVDIQLRLTSPNLTLWGDPEHLAGLIQNLLENAIKYKNKGQKELIIQIEIAGGPTHNTITVADDSMGISPKYIDKIFDKFFRVPTGDQYETKGHGLGLSYVQETVKLHRGDIQVESALKHGTRFIITIPKK